MRRTTAGLLLSCSVLVYATGSVAAESRADLVRQTAARLQTLAQEDDLSGVVLIAKDGKPVFQQAYGYANLADHLPNRIDTKFNLASMNKMFTAVAVMQLVETGKISLQEKFGKYLVDYPNREVADSVTIEQLLTHTSGMGNFWEAHAKLAKERFKTTSDYLPLFVDQPLLFAPGAKFAYSNSGFMVLGLVIEKITGQSYYDYVRERIFRPAGMVDTESYELDGTIPNLANGYSMSLDNPGKWKSNFYTNVFKGTPAGGGFSTAGDLLKFANALLGFKLLNRANTELCTTGKVKYEKGKYAYGFSESIENGHRIVGHSGGHLGIANELMIYTDLGYTVIILTNGEVENYWEASNFIKRQLIGSTPALDSYFFTKKVIEITRRSGFGAGAQVAGKSGPNEILRESVIERYGYKLLFQKKSEPAIHLFKLNALKFPLSGYSYYNLAEAYRVMGQTDLAIENYRKYLAIEPEDKDTEATLTKLLAQNRKN
jgi:CubicO group peptidase (beta-lactamase class C family)